MKNKEVSEELWRERMGNLINIWRKSERPSIMSASKAGDYASHIKKVRLGTAVLDLGCGDGHVWKLLPMKHQYIGVDPFPVNEYITKMKAEDLNIEADTILCFAMLDGCQNLTKVLERVNACARENIVILTGIGIEPDKFHTHKIERAEIVDGLPDFRVALAEEVSPKVWLFDFWRNGFAIKTK